MKNKLRIIGGTWRSRQLVFADVPGLRPTPARVRETLFNWLQYEINGSRCLDLFAGSGALGFEAASRGADRVVQVENQPAACRQLEANALTLGAKRIELVMQDVFCYLARSTAQAFDLVFLDPPFGKGLAVRSCRLLEEGGWLTGNAKIYIEAERGLALDDLPQNWLRLKSKTAGEVSFHLYQRSV